MVNRNVQDMTMRTSKRERSQAARILGQQSYRARLQRLGIERLREIARENGKNGGRPRKGESPKRG